MLEGLSTSHLCKVIKMTPLVHRQDPNRHRPYPLKSKIEIIRELFCLTEQENPLQSESEFGHLVSNMFIFA